MSTSRLEAFSDAVIAIAITLMALEIPLPSQFDSSALLELLRAITVLFVSFMVIGSQWVRHHYLFSRCEEVSHQLLWRNILYLFFISLLPVFTKWIIENPNQVVPALGYDLVYGLLFLSFHSMQRIIFNQMDPEAMNRMKALRKARMTPLTWIGLGLGFTALIGAFVLSLTYPVISIVVFMVLPVVFSVFNLWTDRREQFKMPSQL